MHDGHDSKATPQPIKAVVYVVDDDTCSRELMLALLEPLGHEAVAFPSGEDFLNHFQEDDSTPACVVLDVILPSMNGLNVYQHLQHRGASVPVVFVSGEVGVRTAVDAMKLGAQDFIAKPLDRDRLLNAVQDAVLDNIADKRLRQQKLERQRLVARLTKREKEVMYLLAEGLSTKGIAAKLGINVKTVFVHRSRVLEKLQVDNLVALSAFVQDL